MSYLRTFFENGQVIDDAEVLNKFDAALYDLYQEINGTEVWNNEDTTASFAAQTVTIPSERTVKSYEVLYRSRTAATKDFYATTGKIPFATVANLFVYDATAYYRSVTPSQAEDGTVSLIFSNALSGTTTSNGAVIPWKIKFYYE